MSDTKIPPEVMPYVNPESLRDWVADMQQASADPAAAVTRFVESYRALVTAVKQALEEGMRRQAANELDSSAVGNLVNWQNHTLPLLERHLAAIDAAAAQFAAGDSTAIVSCADSECGLSKNLDGYSMPFAPEKWNEIWDVHVDRVVRTASLVCVAFGK